LISSANDIKTIAVVGAGTMGLGIAQISALNKINTILFDIDKNALNTAKKIITSNLEKGIEKGKITEQDKSSALELLTFESDLNNVKADFIIEAVVEKLEIKHSIFSKLENINSEDTILATNTSSIPITQIAAPLKRPDQVVGMHFFNPAHIMKLVEVISGVATNKNVIEITKQLAIKLGKVPVIAADSPGFIVNRVARHFYVESLKIAEEGVADFQSIDKLVRSSGFKMGPFELMDLIGVDTNFSVTASMFNAFHQDSKFRPSRIQQQKVDAGHNGRKSSKGFYNYD
jgi:3-hydroxybutyryl-CoA dehydrogenase